MTHKADKYEVDRGKLSPPPTRKKTKPTATWVDVHLTKKAKTALASGEYGLEEAAAFIQLLTETEGLCIRVMPIPESTAVRCDIWEQTLEYKDRTYLVARGRTVLQAIQTAEYAFVEMYAGLPPNDLEAVDWWDEAPP